MSKYESISNYESDYEEDWLEFKFPFDGWLTAKDPIFWCLAPAHLEECVWIFRTAPTRQPTDSKGHPLTLLEVSINKGRVNQFHALLYLFHNIFLVLSPHGSYGPA